MMHCVCKEDEAVRCDDCRSNLNIEDAPISQPLKEKLIKWANKYGKWVDWERDQLHENRVQIEEQHKRLSQLLTEEVREELNIHYKVLFSPSTSIAEIKMNNQPY